MQRKSNRKLLWLIAGLIFVLAAGLLCAGLLTPSADTASRGVVLPTVTGMGDDPSPESTAELDAEATKALEELDKLLTPSATTPAAPKAKPVPTKPTIAGDDLVHVGEDVPAGTYRAVERVTKDGPFEICYWSKTRDSEGSDIIDNGIPTGGRPQVTLKKGQWFKSQGCPMWAKR